MFWRGKRVFLTGHTGFKGSWLSLWLSQLGAQVKGYALDPPTTPSLFEMAGVASLIQSVHGDIDDLARMKLELAAHSPEIVFHLAAQALVRASYEDPIGTYQTNVMGTAKLLEAVRACPSVRAVVVITTDKCYENREWPWAYRESDALGGYDPYSNSKAGSELVVSAYRNSFFNPARYSQHGVALASVRAGNVIGGGDWAKERLIPDIMRAFLNRQPVTIRNPLAIRPWQHVLEPLRGYLQLAERLFVDGPPFGESWNFGPDWSDTQTVESIVNQIATAWEGAEWQVVPEAHLHEAQLLRLDWSKAAARFGWRPHLRLSEALRMTVDWYVASSQGTDMRDFTLGQIAAYESGSGFESSLENQAGS